MRQNASVSYRACVVRERSHWGPRGAAGILPFTVTADGRAWVLLSHRSPHVQAGDSWSCFGGAVDEGETPWQAAVREIGEEIRGISVDQAGLLGEHIWECPERCGWSYRTYLVRVPPDSSGGLPPVRVAAGAHAWETSELAWVPVGEVTAGRQLHPAFADAWPALRERIEASVRAPALPTPRCSAPVGWRGLP
jgi:8-oxo-dGTP diphosphatase